MWNRLRKSRYTTRAFTVSGFAEAAHQLRIGYRAGDMWSPHLPAKEALQTEAEHFVDCLRNRATPISNGLTGLRVVGILEAASRSIAARGAPILLQVMPGQSPPRSADALAWDRRSGVGGSPYLPDAG